MSLVSVVYCHLGSDWSLVQRSPTECGVSECDRKASIMRRLLCHGGKKISKIMQLAGNVARMVYVRLLRVDNIKINVKWVIGLVCLNVRTSGKFLWIRKWTQVLWKMEFFFNFLSDFGCTVCLFFFPWRYNPLMYFGSPVAGFSLLAFEVPWSHNDALQSVGLVWTCDQSVAETSTWQHTTLTTDRHPCHGGIRTHDLTRRAAKDLRLRPRGHWDRLGCTVFHRKGTR
jgi:hypothetical protein